MAISKPKKISSAAKRVRSGGGLSEFSSAVNKMNTAGEISAKAEKRRKTQPSIYQDLAQTYGRKASVEMSKKKPDNNVIGMNLRKFDIANKLAKTKSKKK